MWSSSCFISFLLMTLHSSAEGFAISSVRLPWSGQVADPKLDQYAQAQTNSILHLRLNIGRDNDASRLAINGITLSLEGKVDHHLTDRTNKKLVPLPGANGQHPEVSSGPNVLRIVNDGSFISSTGKQTVDLGGDEGRWEMIWRENAPAGALICAFVVPEEIHRNDASLPKGSLYVTLPVWTESGLIRGREHKAKMEVAASKYLQEKDTEMGKIKDTNNPLLKALHYRNAYAAAEKYHLSGINRMNEIPEDDDIVKVGDGLLLCKSGTAWTKKTGFAGGEHILLGLAQVIPDQAD